MICPHCRNKINEVIGADDTPPSEGDIAICVVCFEPSLHFFNDDHALSLRAAYTPREKLDCDIAMGALLEASFKAEENALN